MALTMPVVPGLSAPELALAKRHTATLSARSSHNRLRDHLYEAKHRASLLGVAGAERYSRTATVIGWPAKSVDLMAARTVLGGVEQLSGDDLGIARVLQDNDFESEVVGAVTSHLLHGVSFIVSSRGGAGEPAGMLHVVDARSGTGTWNPRTRRLDDFLSIHQTDDQGTVTAFTLYLPGRTLTAQRTGDGWRVTASTDHDGVPVEALRYRPRPGQRPWGRSRITRPVVALTEAAMRVAMRLEGHADVYALPQVYLLGATPEDLKTPEGAAAWERRIGGIYGIPDNDQGANPRAGLHQLAAASPTPHLEQLRQYAQLFSGETSIPVSSLGVSDLSNPTSADSYIASREDLITEAEATATALSGPISRAVARSVAYAHGLRAAPEDWDIRAHWHSAAHASLASRADAGVKILSAMPWLVSTPLGPELAGLDQRQIARALQYQQRGEATSLIDRILAGGDGADAG